MTKFELPEKPKKTNTSEDFNNLRKAVDELDKFDYAWKTYANKADRRINAANKHIEELERVNQQLVAENLSVKTLVDSAKQQQALPVVPECVAEFIEDCKKEGDCLFGVFADATRVEHDMPDLVYFWLGDEGNNDELFARAWLDGYQVEKPQLFYLKHIDMSKADKECDWYLITDCVKLCHEWVGKNLKPKDDDFKFTQQEIDSMETGSYEQIEVAE
ncbi:Phage protein [Lactococcus lactis subsp. lactis]|uniref:DUF1642 domain-containing protein n=1 Tax=Lactococcus lactis TaxID=1358 RepID=UPI00071C1EC1|nr:DUF1642 domain-containing protein [Lactococcus lactis]KST85391.1 Phage protein [Lactococcus lactis subsp. lactis]